MSDAAFLSQVAQNPDAYIAYIGEFMLAKMRDGKSWQVTFDIAMDQDSHPFNRYTGKATGKAGTLFKVLLVEVNGEGELINQDQKFAAEQATGGQYERLKGEALVKESGILRNNYQFQLFLYHKLGDMDRNSRNDLLGNLPYRLLSAIQKTKGLALKNAHNGSRFANHMVHYLCSVYSCKEFKYNKNAALEFIELRQEFINWAHQDKK